MISPREGLLSTALDKDNDVLIQLLHEHYEVKDPVVLTDISLESGVQSIECIEFLHHLTMAEDSVDSWTAGYAAYHFGYSVATSAGLEPKLDMTLVQSLDELTFDQARNLLKCVVKDFYQRNPQAAGFIDAFIEDIEPSAQHIDAVYKMAGLAMLQVESAQESPEVSSFTDELEAWDGSVDLP